ncbi:hypothetical protein T265_04391 [Opisthorchis viverrini]|uniref:Uncharacterized protein n=1 Tax=Opisthorchis viverrini TaxID=6198 RepID=A0A075AGL7_OPIVI|nr:hypothetical protein T265_04391 [Opisthorchis viverrini]KER28849.1 hypothetical protein T265_04391 [Opisthorchis viverrini]
MNFTYTYKLMPHRPLRGAISRVALLAAYSRAGWGPRDPHCAYYTTRYGCQLMSMAFLLSVSIQIS